MFFPELVIPSGRPDGATELASEKSAEDKTVVTEGRQERVSPASQSPAAKEPLAAEKPAVAEKPVEAEKPTAGTESAAKPAPATETVSSKNAPSPADPPNRDTGDAAIANGVAVAAADTHANRIAPDTTLAQTTSIYGSVFVVAAGLVVALLILAAVTFRVLRPR
jgi:hypothetical protein